MKDNKPKFVALSGPEVLRALSIGVEVKRELPNWPAYYNAAPTTALPVLRQGKDGGGRELVLMTWGLIPWFSKDHLGFRVSVHQPISGARYKISDSFDVCQQREKHGLGFLSARIVGEVGKQTGKAVQLRDARIEIA